MATLQIAPGYVVIDVSRSSGGITYDRETITDNAFEGARRVEFVTVKRVDHDELVKAIHAVVKNVDHILRTRCVRTTFGHFAPAIRMDDIRERVHVLVDQVDELNRRAEAAGSLHRGRVGIVAAYLDLEQPEVIEECRRTVYDLLREIYEVLAAGDVLDVVDDKGRITKRHRLRAVMLRANNLADLVTGKYAVAVAGAIASVREIKADVITRIRAGDSASVAGASVDMVVLETAIKLFGNLHS